MNSAPNPSPMIATRTRLAMVASCDPNLECWIKKKCYHRDRGGHRGHGVSSSSKSLRQPHRIERRFDFRVVVEIDVNVSRFFRVALHRQNRPRVRWLRTAFPGADP